MGKADILLRVDGKGSEIQPLLADHTTSISAIKYRNRTALVRGIEAERVERDNLMGRVLSIGQGTVRKAQNQSVSSLLRFHPLS